MKPLPAWLVSVALVCAPAHAQSAEWERTMLIYLLGAGIDGKTQIGPLESDIDQSFSSVLENLDVGAMGSFRASNDTWAHVIDAMYTSLSGDAALPTGGRIGVEIDQLIASYDIGYRIGQYFEVLGGVRYNSIDMDIAFGLPDGVRRASGSKDWFDPYVGARTTIPLNETFAFTLRGDIGGFDVGSKLAWQAAAWLSCNFSETFVGIFGYRILDTDYEDGSGASAFKYDVAIHGPGIGFGWRFR